MNLYYVSATDSNGDSLDLMVNTTSREQALRLWRNHWDEWILYSKPITAGMPPPDLKDRLLIYEAIYDPDTEAVLEWGRDLEIVAHVPG